MAITIRGMAQVKIPPEHLQEVLGMYVHTPRDGSFIRNYRYSSKDGHAYLPLNPDFTFRPHQINPSAELLQVCRKENFALLSAGCGNGKTVVMTWVAGMLGHRVLILVDMGSLLT